MTGYSDIVDHSVIRALEEEIEQQEHKRWILAILARVQIEPADFVDIDLRNVDIFAEATL